MFLIVFGFFLNLEILRTNNKCISNRVYLIAKKIRMIKIIWYAKRIYNNTIWRDNRMNKSLFIKKSVNNRII